MKDHFLIRFVTFTAFAAMAILLLFWFRGHLRYSVICTAAAILVYGVGGFISPPFGNAPALGTKGLRAGVTLVALVLMACGFFLQMRG